MNTEAYYALSLSVTANVYTLISPTHTFPLLFCIDTEAGSAHHRNDFVSLPPLGLQVNK